MNYFIIKDNKEYSLKDGLNLELPFIVQIDNLKLDIKEKYVHFRRTIGAFNSEFKTQFIAVGDGTHIIFYHPDTATFIWSESDLDKYVNYLYTENLKRSL